MGGGAHGIIDENQTITGRYAGNYHGTDVYESGSLQKEAGITLPGRGIIVSRGAYSLNNDPWLIKHEFGHILQAEKFGYYKFYDKIAPMSLKSAALNPNNHHKFWTEVMANNLSFEYFDNPIDWPTLRFPLRYENWNWIKFWRQ